MIKNVFLSSSKKNLGVLIMIISLILQMVIPVVAADVEDNTAYLNNVTLLEKLGILVDEDGMQYSEETISRENFAQMLGVFYGISRVQTDSVIGKGMFEDVSSKASNCVLIETVVDAGAMDGYKDKKFRPASSLTVEQAAKAMVVLLGYDSFISFVGSDISDYTQKAQELDLLDGVKTAYSKPITKAELVKMFCNALDTEMLQVTNVGYEKKYETIKNETLLSEKLGVYKIDGILQATEITSIGKFDNCYKNYILVDDYEIYTEEDMNEYLGMHLNVYCTGDDYEELEMIHFFGKEKKNAELIISADDIVDVNNSIVSYDLNDRTKKIRLPETVTVIYNGKNYPLYSDDTFKINEGSLRFLDADNDGKYEIVSIKSYISVWVGQIYNDDGNISIVDADNPANKYSVDTEDINKTIKFKKNGALASFSDVKNKSIVSIAADKMDIETKKILPEATYIEILISDATVSGALESVYSAEQKMRIDGVSYDMNRDFNLTSYDVSVGDLAKFYLDAFGKIIAAEKGESNLYGILDRAFTDESEEHIAGLKIFSSDGAFKTFECSKKLTVDGKRYNYTEIEKIKTALKNGSNKFFLDTGISSTGASNQFQLIKYSTNSDGQIVMIDTLVQNSTDFEIEKNYLSFSKKFEKDTRYFSKAYATTIDGGYIYDSNIIVFRLPYDKGNKDAFSKKNGLGTLGYEILDVPVYAFDANEFNHIPIMMAESEATDNVPQKEDNNMMIFEKLTKELSDDGEVYNVMNGTAVKSGAAIKAYMEEAEYQQFIGLGIKAGDIVRWSTDDLNVVTSIEHLVKNIGNESSITIAGSSAGINATGFYSDFRITCGTVEEFDNKYIMFNLGTLQEASLINPSTKVLVYNSDTGITENGDYSAIKTAEAFGSDASLVFTYQWYTAINTIVIFN